MYVVFSGPSSSGKSLLIKKTSINLKVPKYSIKIIEEDSFYTVSLLKKILGNSFFKKFNSRSMKSEKEKDGNFFVDTLVSYAYPLVVLTEYLLSYLYHSIFSRKKYVFRDRGLLDYYITFRINHSFDNVIVNLYPYFFGLSTINIVLLITTNESMKRNKNNIQSMVTSRKSFHNDVKDSYMKLGEKCNLVLKNNNKKQLKSNIKSIQKVIDFKSKHRVAIIGLDGSGKSTISSRIVNEMNEMGIDAKSVHFYHNSLIYRFLKYLNMWEDHSVEENYKKNVNRKRDKRFVWALFHYLDSYFQYSYFNIRYWNKNLIFDRYFHDYIASFKYYNVKYRSVFSKLIPGVDLLLYLKINGTTAYKRKPENIKSFFISNAKEYSKIAKKFEATTVDTNGMSLDKVYAKVEKCFLK